MWKTRKREKLETHLFLGIWENGDVVNIEREGRRRREYEGQRNMASPILYV